MVACVLAADQRGGGGEKATGSEAYGPVGTVERPRRDREHPQRTLNLASFCHIVNCRDCVRWWLGLCGLYWRFYFIVEFRYECEACVCLCWSSSVPSTLFYASVDFMPLRFDLVIFHQLFCFLAI